ncbi:MAG: sugar transferase [Xanthobacteraceae bacterium]
MRARIEHDLHYIDNWSLWFDVRILLLTFCPAPRIATRTDGAPVKRGN